MTTIAKSKLFAIEELPAFEVLPVVTEKTNFLSLLSKKVRKIALKRPQPVTVHDLIGYKPSSTKDTIFLKHGETQGNAIFLNFLEKMRGKVELATKREGLPREAFLVGAGALGGLCADIIEVVPVQVFLSRS